MLSVTHKVLTSNIHREDKYLLSGKTIKFILLALKKYILSTSIPVTTYLIMNYSKLHTSYNKIPREV